jgi:hypothetical protein
VEDAVAVVRDACAPLKDDDRRPGSDSTEECRRPLALTMYLCSVKLIPEVGYRDDHTFVIIVVTIDSP